MYSLGSILGAYLFIIVLSSWWIYPYYYYKLTIYHNNILVKIFVRKSILSDIGLATPALSCLLFAWYIIFHPFSFKLFLSIYVESKLVFFLNPLCHCSSFIGRINPFIFHVITDKIGFISVIFLCFNVIHIFLLFLHYYFLLC